MKEDFPYSLVPFLVVCLSFLYIHAYGDTVQFVRSFHEARGRSSCPSVDVSLPFLFIYIWNSCVGVSLVCVVLRMTKLVAECGVTRGLSRFSVWGSYQNA